MFLGPADSLSPNPDRLIADAKVALGLARSGYPPRAAPQTSPPSAGPPSPRSRC